MVILEGVIYQSVSKCCGAICSIAKIQQHRPIRLSGIVLKLL